MLKKRLNFFYNKWLWATTLTTSLVALTSLSWNIIQTEANGFKALQLEAIKNQQDAAFNWGDSASNRLVDLFPQTQIALQVLSQLKINVTDGPTVFAQGINSFVTKEQLGKIKFLDFSNMGLTNVNEVLQLNIVWTNLWQINLSSNNFANIKLVFNQNFMPKLYKIIVTNSHLTQMVDVSSYVKDPFDKSTDSTEEHTAAKQQYSTPITAGVPRYFDLANNQITEIPKYYLKINIAYLNLSNNALGTGSQNDPMGVNALPWYSLAETNNKSGLLAIQDKAIRGPYGIDVYSTSEKNADGTYKYSDEQVARWRQSPFPIRGLTFGNYNDVPSSSDSLKLDQGITHAYGTSPASGGKNPFFNFANNSIVAPMIFSATNVNYDANSTIVPQEKSVNIYAGLEDFKKSGYYQAQQNIIKTKTSTDPTNPNANAEMLVPQPDSIYPILNQIGFSAEKTRLQWRWNRPLFGIYTVRSFNGFGLFEQTTDSRTAGSDDGYDSWSNEKETDGKIKNAGTEAQMIDGSEKGIKWRVPKASDFQGNTSRKFTDLSTGVTINDFISATGTESAGKKQGWWGTNDNKVNTVSSTEPILSFDDAKESSVQTHYKRYKPFRTYLVTAKSFAKTDPTASYSKVFDGNVYYDTKGYENYAFKIQFFPSGKNTITYDPNYSTLAMRTLTTNGIKHFVNYYSNNTSMLIDSLAPANWISNIDRDSSFGLKKNIATPYSVYFNSVNGLYKYSSFYNVVDTIATELDQDHNFATSVSETSADGLNLNTYTNKFPQNVIPVNIINGKNKFWKSTKQFDQVFLSKLRSQDIKINYNPEVGELTYEFWIYSPGYSRNGRLLKSNVEPDKNKNETKTIDLKIKKTVTGFAQAKMQKENATGEFENFSSKSVDASNAISYPAPKSIKDLITTVSNYSKLNETLIAKTLKTNYLGNKAVNNATAATIEENQHQLSELKANWIKNLVINGRDGTVQFNVEIPDYRFNNGNVLAYPPKLKAATYIWTTLPKATTTIIGSNPTAAVNNNALFQPFVASTFIDDLSKKLVKFQALQKKAASTITAKDIFYFMPVIKTDVATWTTEVNKENASKHFILYPNDANGSLLFQIQLPADPTNYIPQQSITVLWENLFKQTTSLVWKSQKQIAALIQGKVPEQVAELFKNDPSQFLDWINPPPNSDSTSMTPRKITKEDLEFDKSKNVIQDVHNGRVQFNNIKLKNFYQNGILFANGVSVEERSKSARSVPDTIHNYLDVLISPNYQAQPPVSSLKWKDDSKILEAIKSYLKKHNLIQLNPNEFDLTNKEKINTYQEQVLSNMNVYDYQQVIINFNLNLADLNIFDLTNITAADLVFNPTALKNNIEVNNKTGNLTFKNIQFNNWQANNQTTKSIHTVESKTITAPKVINSFKWANNLSNALAVLPVNIVQTIFASPTEGAKYIDALNVGKKTFNPKTNQLENTYTINPSKIIVDVIKGTLQFKANAITISNYVSSKDSAATNFYVDEEKTYSLVSKFSTNYFINTLITSVNGYKDKYAQFFFNQPYNDAPADQKVMIDKDLQDLQAPNFVFKSPQIAKGLIQQSILNQNEAKITQTDLALINTLKKADKTNLIVQQTDFTNFFYLPKYLGFVSSLSQSGINRTYFVARTINNKATDAGILVVYDAFIINYFKEGQVSILPLGNLVYPGFLWDGTTINFKKQDQQENLSQHLQADGFILDKKPNYLPVRWQNSTPQEMAADLNFLTKNRNDQAVKNTTKWQEIQKAWLATFSYTNVPYDGSQDGTIAYPSVISFSPGEHTLKITELIFPFFTNTKFRDNSTTAISLDQKVPVAAIWYLTKGANTTFSLNNSSVYERFLVQTPDQALSRLGLQVGAQTNKQKAFDQFLKQKIYELTFISPSVLTNNPNLPNYLIPSGEIGNISVDSSTGIMTLSQIIVKNAWLNGNLAEAKPINDIQLQFVVISSQLLANNATDATKWLKTTFGQKKSISELLVIFENKVKDGSFTVEQFNAMVQSNQDLVVLDSLLSDQDTKAQFNSVFNLKNSVSVDYIKGTITLSNLEIVNGYVKNQKQSQPIVVHPITINLHSDFTTTFTADFQPVIDLSEFSGMSPSNIKAALDSGSFDLMQYLNFSYQFQKIETPKIDISANDVLGTITFDVKFDKYYQNGVFVGVKNFQFEYTSLKAWLPLILGLIGAFVGVSLILTTYLLYRYFNGKKDRYIQMTCKAKKTE